MPSNLGLTVEQFQQFPGCGAYSRPEAEEIIQHLSQFAHLAYAVQAANNPTTPPAELAEDAHNVLREPADDQ